VLVIVTHAGSIAAGVGRAFRCICVCLSTLLKKNGLSYQHQTHTL